jgi:hypothetical protein
VRREGPNSIIDRARINHATALGEPFRHLGLAEPIAQLPADGKGDDGVGKPVPAEGRSTACCAASSTRSAPIYVAPLPMPSSLDKVFTLAAITVHPGSLLSLASDSVAYTSMPQRTPVARTITPIRHPAASLHTS